MAKANKLKELESRLGHIFADRARLQQALTHASVRTGKKPAPDNERLEFLGDRVLGLAIAELLTEIYPAANEGDLARRFNRLVRGEACAAVGRALDLPSHLVLGDSEADSGGREKGTILADAVEAILGAIFLEAGFDAAREVVRRHWQQFLGTLPETAVDAKSALQEWAQGQGLELPCYTELTRLGPDHKPRFTSSVSIGGRAPAQGSGANKRQAEQAAATALLMREGVWKVPDRPATGD